MSNQDRSFPVVPAYRASWAPIYLEPIIGSGERITIGIAAWDKAGSYKVVQTLRDDAIACLLGSTNSPLANIIENALESLTITLTSGRPIELWKPPFSGLVVGDKKEFFADDMNTVLRLALRMASSFGSMDSLSSCDEQEHSSTSDSKDKWIRMVKEEVQNRNPSLTQYFNRSFHIAQGARPTAIDFIGSRSAINLGKLQPGPGLSTLINRAKTKLWNLSSLRDFESKGLLAQQRTFYELLLWRPSDDNPGFTDTQIEQLHEALTELEVEGDRHDLRVVPLLDPQTAADRIINSEAA